MVQPERRDHSGIRPLAILKVRFPKYWYKRNAKQMSA